MVCVATSLSLDARVERRFGGGAYVTPGVDNVERFRSPGSEFVVSRSVS